MMRTLAVACLALWCSAPSLGQDLRRWNEALAVYQRSASHRDPAERARAVQELGLATFPKVDKLCWKLVLPVLRREIGREGRDGRTEEQVSGAVLEACLDTLRRLESPYAVALMARVAQSRREHARLRFYLITALAGSGDAKTLTGLLDDPAPIVQIAAAGALAERGEAGSVPTFLRLLRDRTRTWEVKIVALEGLRKAADEKVVDDLIASLGQVRVEEGRLKDQYLETLQELTGLNLESDDPNAWKAAWTAKKDGDKIPEGRTITVPTEFYGLKTRSTRIVFVLDRTGSMEMPGSEPKRTVFKLPPEATMDLKRMPRENAARSKAQKLKKKWDELKVKTRMDAAKKELINTVFVLNPKVHFNVVWYESTAVPWQKELVPATWQNKLDCIRQADRMTPGGNTNTWGGLEHAFKMTPDPRKPGVVRYDRKANYATAVGGADTFYLLTDGKPNEGRLISPPEIILELRKVNRLRRVKIHTICVGDLLPGLPPDAPENPDPDFLLKVAQESGGEFMHFKK